MDLSPEQAEAIARYALSVQYPAEATVGPRVLAALLRALDNQRALNQKILGAYTDQAQQLYTAQTELAELRCPGGQGGVKGGETGSEPPPPIAPPVDAARMLAEQPGELPRRLPTAGELFWEQQRARYVSAHRQHPEHDETHAPMVNASGYCSACSLLLALRTGTA